MKVVELFESIEGEGKRAGKLATFIRLAGCNIRCGYCDSTYSFDVNQATTMSADDILKRCIELGHPAITLTGGEPLVHPDAATLIAELSNCDMFDVNIETNGTVDPSKYHLCKNVWFTVDYKCPSSGCQAKMNPKAFSTLREQDVLKFVVGSDQDLNVALDVLRKYNPKAQVYFSPVFGYDGKNIVNFMLKNHLDGCKVQLQIHKYIWDPNERGV